MNTHDIEPTQEELEDFIFRAGFRWGWSELESWARRMAEQAVREKKALQSQDREDAERYRRLRKGEPEYLISACYFPNAGEVELSWERKEDGAKACLTAKVTPEQGEQIANVFWPGVYFTAAQQPEAVDGACAVAAIQFALTDQEGMTFLRLWNEGEFDTLRREWPDAPSEVYVGADPLYAKHREPTT